MIEELLKREDIEISKDKIEKFKEYIEILKKWNRVHNLTALESDIQIAKNIIDSIYPVKFLTKPINFLDIGTGAGFPGIFLAIIWDDIDSFLVEPRNKRAAFLQYLKVKLKLNNTNIIKKRVEEIKDIKAHLITSRAVSRAKDILKLSENIRSRECEILLYKGSEVKRDILDLNGKVEYTIITYTKRNYLWIKRCY
ncbi:MAG: 16S rRNA (guanine(527)-N(7))-methyltransferase RsmG [Epsilonproteobacteria bacterium]|nr:16S rRNA (guanine(527)-N(7))-methyltransferase RsmG [Campylobacterota bacterium]